MALFNGLEQFFEELPSLISQARRQLHSDNINIPEHFGRRLKDALDVLNIFKIRFANVLTPIKLINFISDVISQTDMLLNCTADPFSSTHLTGILLLFGMVFGPKFTSMT